MGAAQVTIFHAIILAYLLVTWTWNAYSGICCARQYIVFMCSPIWSIHLLCEILRYLACNGIGWKQAAVATFFQNDDLSQTSISKAWHSITKTRAKVASRSPALICNCSTQWETYGFLSYRWFSQGFCLVCRNSGVLIINSKHPHFGILVWIQNILILEFWCELNFVNPPQNAAFSSSCIRSTCVM